MSEARPKVFIKFRGQAVDQLTALADYFKDDLTALDLTVDPRGVVMMGVINLQTIKEKIEEDKKEEKDESPKPKTS